VAGAAIAAKALSAVPGDGGDDAIHGDLSDTMVGKVCDIEIAFGINRYAGGSIQLCLRGWAAIPGKTCRTVPGDHGDDILARECVGGL